MSLAIVYVGARSGTSLHRAQALERLGHRVRHVDSAPPVGSWRKQVYRVGLRLRRPPDLCGAGGRLLEELRRRAADVVWVDKGLTLRPRVLEAARRLAPEAAFVSYSPDDMASSQWNSVPYLRCLHLYDLHVTTKSYNVAELGAMGAREVLFVDNAFDPETHRPLELSGAERERWGCDVGFIGIYEEDRARHLLALARRGVRVCVRGPLWRRLRGDDPNLRVSDEWLDGLDYTRAINATRINLGFLRKGARDLQTTRSVEIPACGGFLLAERTDEHARLFAEGREAEFFDGFDELLAKCRRYLENEEQRAAVAAAGRRRCVEDGYSNDERLRGALERLRSLRPPASRAQVAPTEKSDYKKPLPVGDPEDPNG